MLLLTCVFSACSVIPRDSYDPEDGSPNARLTNTKAVKPQLPPDSRIRSVELFRDRPGNPPVLVLGSERQLTLRFDELAEAGNSFLIRVQHYNADWTESRLPSGVVSRGFSDDTISGGTPSVGQFPSFFSYSYTFPNRNLNVQISGNFMLEVYDYVSRDLLFSLPFFVTEDRGSLRAEVSEHFRDSRFPNHQIYTEYQFPDFVSMPLIDIDVYVVQNQFWGRSRKTTERDVSAPGLIRLHLNRDDSFPGRYEFRPLLIDDIFSISRDVIEVRPERDPPLIRLQFDVVDLDISPRITRARSYSFGEPRTGRNARYTEVEFNLERPRFLSPEEDIFVLGSFTNWNLSEEQRMVYDPASDAFSTRVLIKEGRYDYTYAVIENNRLDDLRLSSFFAQTSQDYQILVYFRDQQQQFDRLLQFGTIRSR
ncbi:protein of unknown function (DUF5103) [Cyclonatronum proteinivorum]|uniref:Type 9 secretion system plug protein N-terminal domain-containing protein n=1 Tax=Cyclonatronum proteinivorum TaxID=1457365 RepID=A0A345UMC8_9BACT|nr:type IX secretion system plug protein domain-containing protein [Cyclonatronum proteinivorum]AXJ01630.1 protein of unknown function (DUF5103) [Cyclonatronum proteinivorum]